MNDSLCNESSDTSCDAFGDLRIVDLLQDMIAKPCRFCATSGSPGCGGAGLLAGPVMIKALRNAGLSWRVPCGAGGSVLVVLLSGFDGSVDPCVWIKDQAS
jgi:hypothetical protein